MLSHLYRHHKWANVRLIDHLAALPEEHLQRRAPGGFGSIHETLFHLFANEARFLQSFEGRAISLESMPAELPSCAEIREMANSQGDRLIELAGTLTEDSKVGGTFQGQQYEMPAYIPLFQAYHHASEHRTNITSILATYDIPTPRIDLWAFMEAGEAR